MESQEKDQSEDSRKQISEEEKSHDSKMKTIFEQTVESSAMAAYQLQRETLTEIDTDAINQEVMLEIMARNEERCQIKSSHKKKVLEQTVESSTLGGDEPQPKTLSEIETDEINQEVMLELLARNEECGGKKSSCESCSADLSDEKRLEQTTCGPEFGTAPNEGYEADRDIKPRIGGSKPSSFNESTDDDFEIQTDMVEGQETQDESTDDDFEIQMDMVQGQETQDSAQESDDSEGHWEGMHGLRSEVVRLAIELSQALVEFMALVSDTEETLQKFRHFRSLRTMEFYDKNRCVRNNIVSLVRYTEKIIQRTVRDRGGWTQAATRSVRLIPNRFRSRDSMINDTIREVWDVIWGLDVIVKDFHLYGLNATQEELSLYHFGIDVWRDALAGIQKQIATVREADPTRPGLEIEDYWMAKIRAKTHRMSQRMLESTKRKRKTKNKKKNEMTSTLSEAKQGEMTPTVSEMKQEDN